MDRAGVVALALRGPNVVFGVSLEEKKKGRRIAFVVAMMLAVATVELAVAHPASARPVHVIVRAAPGAERLAADAVRSSGGSVVRRLDLIDAVAATVPSAQLGRLRLAPGVVEVVRDARVHLEAQDWSGNPDGSLLSTTRIVGARDMWRAGFTGQGVDVALIDSGVAPVPGLDAPGKVVNAVDYSFDAPSPDLRYLDAYGHGTHLAGIIAGRDATVQPGKEHTDVKSFQGMAPDARIVNVKVGAANGVVDVSQVIAGIGWVVRHHDDPGLNIQVLSLSFGTDSTQSYLLDPLAYAAEVAWHEGIVVVVAAGNAGFGDDALNDPALDPYVIAVGADDPSGTYPVNDDVIPSWSSRGDGVRNPDLVAPGVSIASLRDPGSAIDVENPQAVVADRYFRGTGTSQAAAVVSGAIALIEEQRPGIAPDEVKALLTSTAASLPATDPVAQGAGELDLKAAMKTATPAAVQTWPTATGLGSLEAARGSAHVAGPDGLELTGEVDVLGRPFDALRWSDADWDALRWSDLTWTGLRWSDLAWVGLRWSGLRWSGITWDGLRWSALRWSGLRWSDSAWAGTTWS